MYVSLSYLVCPSDDTIWECISNFTTQLIGQVVIHPCWGQSLPILEKGPLGSRLVCILNTVYPKKYAHGFCFAVLCCGYTLTDFPISIRLTSLALWQSNDCPSASKATLMNMDKYFM